MKTYLAKNETETAKIAAAFARTLKGGEVLALSGNLGAGKTVFIKALAKELGIKDSVTSPTFVLMKVYDIHPVKSRNAGAIKSQFDGVKYKEIEKFIHVDCYRLQGKEDLAEIGLADYLELPHSLVAVEWADKVVGLPTKTIWINLEILDSDQRKITIEK